MQFLVGVRAFDGYDLGTGGSGDTDGIPNDDFQIWATDSTNGGTTFAPNFQVSQGTSNAIDANSFFDTGDYTHAAFVAGAFWPAWSDNSNSTGDNPDGTLHQFDLYTAKVAQSLSPTCVDQPDRRAVIRTRRLRALPGSPQPG